MIFSHVIPWRVMTVPAAIGVFLVCVVPAPLLIIIEWIKRSYRAWSRNRSAAFVAAHAEQVFFLYTQRPDSTVVLRDEVIPQLQAVPVRLENLRIVDKQYRALQGIVPSLLGASFPIVVRCTDGAMQLIPLHDCVYTEQLCLRDASDICTAITQRLAE